MKLIVTNADDTQDVYAEGVDPFMDILSFAYSGESGLRLVVAELKCIADKMEKP